MWNPVHSTTDHCRSCGAVWVVHYKWRTLVVFVCVWGLMGTGFYLVVRNDVPAVPTIVVLLAVFGLIFVWSERLIGIELKFKRK